MEILLTKAGIISLLTLSVMEIVLGIDNIIFISIIASKLPSLQQNKARQLGLTLALLVRVGLLFIITWIIGLKTNLFTIFDMGFSGRDLILLGGGLFLIAKTTSEIHEKLEGPAQKFDVNKSAKKVSFSAVIIQIVIIDIIFSFDSILTAIGLAEHIEIMVLAVIISMGVMFVFARRISIFVNRRPTIKMLALSFLILIGVLLVAEAFDQHVNKGYVYFAMAFALIVEMLNIQMRKNVAKPVRLRGIGDIEVLNAENKPGAKPFNDRRKQNRRKPKPKSVEPMVKEDTYDVIAVADRSNKRDTPSMAKNPDGTDVIKKKSRNKRRKRKPLTDHPGAPSKAD